MVEGGRGSAQPGIGRAVITRAAAGDRDALATIWRAYQPGLLRYLRGMSVRLADDVASQVWLEAARSLHRFEGDDRDLRRWLFTIARRRMIDAYRAEGRRREDPAGARPYESAGVGPARLTSVPGSPSAPDAPEDVVTEAGGGPALAAVRRLAPAQAEVVLLRVVGGFSVDEVAAMTGKSPGAVRVIAHRALRRLAQMLEPDRGPGSSPTSAGATAGDERDGRRRERRREAAPVTDAVVRPMEKST
jgi:RNA polymerase sigma-70 factor (ECF subfamily)